jgi:hypothetical protein
MRNDDHIYYPEEKKSGYLSEAEEDSSLRLDSMARPGISQRSRLTPCPFSICQQ